MDVSDLAFKVNPNSPIVLYWRGFIYEVLGRFDDALIVYNKLVYLDGDNPEVWNARVTY